MPKGPFTLSTVRSAADTRKYVTLRNFRQYSAAARKTSILRGAAECFGHVRRVRCSRNL